MRASVAILFAPLLLLACEGSTSPGVRIELIDPTGENAAFGIIEGTLSIDLKQGEALLCTEGCETVIRGGDFELTLPIESLAELTTIHGQINGGDTPTVGAVPPFTVAGEGLETGLLPVRLVMMPPGTCETLEVSNVSSDGPAQLVEARRGAAAVVRRNVVLLAGGTGASGGSNRIDFFDDVVVEMRLPLEDPPGPLGPTVGLALNKDQSLLVGDTAWLYISQMGPPGPSPIEVHDGADGTSALIAITGIVGIIGGTATREITWMTTSGMPVDNRYPLSVERPGAIVASGSRNGALVVGGAPGGEWIAPNTGSGTFDGLPDASGGWLTVSPSGEKYLWIGATGADTWEITGCPSACTASPGSIRWDRARDGASGVTTQAGALWIVGGEGSQLVDIVRWEGETPVIEEGPSLVTARAGASVVEHASGVVLAIGGQGTMGFLDDVEICTPAVLDAL